MKVEELAAVVDDLIEVLHLRIRKLRGVDPADTREGGEGPATSTGK